ncbi:MAG: hypothetical protein JWM98_1686 [Thermoleophilia bacterium]|nr:hypothetical protein [Thermoleophilia bacterium]
MSTKPRGAGHGGFNGGPSMWLASPRGSTWIEAGSSCWKNGCGDSIGPSCASRGQAANGTAIPGSPRVEVRRGEPLDLHLVGVDRATEHRFEFTPRDVAGEPRDVAGDERAATTWRITAPEEEGVLSSFIRAADGDATFAACLVPRGAKDVRASDRVIATQAQAELAFRIDASGGTEEAPEPGSLHCHRASRPEVSATKLWRCEALFAGRSPRTGFRARGTVSRFGAGLAERDRLPVTVIDANVARTRPPDGLVAVRGYLVDDGSGFQTCAAGYLGDPPTCNKGGVDVSGLDHTAYRLDEAGGSRFTREDVIVFGRIQHRTLLVDQP